MQPLLSLLWLMTTIEITSATTCPSVEDIQRLLLPLLPSAEGKAPDQADLQPLPDTPHLRLRLNRADGELMGTRDLAASGRCDELAQKVAVLLASWESDAEPGMPWFAAEEKAAHPARATWEMQIGAGAGAATIGGVALVGLLESSLAPIDKHWQLRLNLMVETARKTALAKGQVAWRHYLGSLAVAWRTLDRAWLLAGDAGLTAGFATLSGEGFSVDQSSGSMEYGVTGGLRLGLRWRRFTLFGESRGVYWIRHQRASLGGIRGEMTLEPWDLVTWLGASVSFFL